MSLPYPTIEHALAVVEREARALPSATSPYVCQYCYGSKGAGHNQCYGCHCLLKSGATESLLKRVVPVSIAEAPGAWYSRMASYKGGVPENSYLLAAALFAAISAWREDIELALSGAIDAVCITPSTKGTPMREQRLAGVVRLVERFLPPVEPLLTAVDGKVKPRNSIDATLFHGTRAEIDGKRILLVEDTWVTGAAAMSAAMTLLNGGAKEVLVMPIARRVETASVLNVHGTGYQEALEAASWRASSLAWPK